MQNYESRKNLLRVNIYLTVDKVASYRLYYIQIKKINILKQGKNPATYTQLTINKIIQL